MAQFIGTSMPRGFAGMLTRGFYDNTVEVKTLDAGQIPAGGLVKLNAGKAAAVTAAADAVYGFVVREYTTAGQDQKFVGVLRRGYIAVKITDDSNPAVGGEVYLTSAGALTATKGSNTKLASAQFMGTKDADGLVELAFNI